MPMTGRLLAAFVLCMMSPPLAVTQSGGCEPHGKVRFICGAASPEDLVRVPRSDWVIASGYIGGTIHLINVRDYTVVKVFPTRAPRERWAKTGPYAACPGPIHPVDGDKFSSHGLAVAAGPNGVHIIYVVHHGLRESVEVFQVDAASSPPTFTWIGCVLAPVAVDNSVNALPTGLNSISPVPGGGFVVTNTVRRRSPVTDNTNTGEIWEWSPKEGWRIVP